MRSYAVLALAITLGMQSNSPAGGLLRKLPEDGTWTSYSSTQVVKQPKQDDSTHEGHLTLASVGKEEVDGKMCRWIEIRIESKQPELKSIFKILVPEESQRKGKQSLGKVIKGWMKLGNQKPRPISDELLSNPATLVNSLLSDPEGETRVLGKKAIETKLGKLTCEGIGGTLTLKDAARNLTDGNLKTKDIEARIEIFPHSKAPFGVAWHHLAFDSPEGFGNGSVASTLVLEEVGTGAKSELPDHN